MTTNDEIPLQAPESMQPRRSAPGWVLPAVITGTAGLLLGIGGTLGVQAAGGAMSALTAVPTPTPTADSRLYDASAGCGGGAGIKLGDDDRTMTIDVKGNKDYEGASYSTQECILRALNAPSSVSSHIGQTTAMDGRQTESWEGITIEWSYHPDRGADMVIKLDEPKA